MSVTVRFRPSGWVPVTGFDGVAELPRAEVDFSTPSVATTITVRSSGGDHTTLQAAWDAITDRSGGYEIVIDAAYDPGPLTTGAQTGDDSDWVVVRVANASTNLPRHQRVFPADTTNMVDFPVDEDGNGAGFFLPAISVATATKRVRFVGLNLYVPAGQAGAFPLVDFTQSASGPQYIIIDRCIVQGRDTTTDIRRGVAWNGIHVGIIDSYLYDINDSGSDSQAVWGHQGAGPYAIINSYLEAAGENVMFGGSDADDAESLPQDIHIARCHLFKPTAWQADANANVKNTLEFKHGLRILVEDCVFENCWADSQSGFALVFKSTNQTAAPFSETADLTLRYNKLINSPGGISLSAHGDQADVVEMNSLSIHDNLLYDVMGNAQFTAAGDLRGLMLLKDIKTITFQRNTVVGGAGSGNGVAALLSKGATEGVSGLRILDNIFSRGEFGVLGDSSSEGTAGLDDHTDGSYDFLNNVIYGDGATTPPDQYPATTTRLQGISNVGFEDEANDDYRLASGSSLKGTASDGGDPGADVATINSKTAHSVDGDWSSDPWSS